jgi:6,7-dimethyl-8-ribityllumazine synthase
VASCGQAKNREHANDPFREAALSRGNGPVRFQPDADGSGLRIGVVVARFNPELGDALLDACLQELQKLGVHDSDVSIATVPGSLEAPLALQRLANTGRFDALIALGAVIRGETYHFEVVSNESASGITSVQLDASIPIANGILTTDTEEQAQARTAGKGRDCARVAVEMARLMRKIDERQ